MHSPFDPRRPYADEIEALNCLHEVQDAALVRKQCSQPLAHLFGDVSLFECKADASEAQRITAFGNHVSSPSRDIPAPEVFKAASVLDEWCAIHDCDTVILIGIVTGHPDIRDRARTRTSLLLQVHREEGWARTWNQHYRLGAHSRLTFFEGQYEGKISPRMQSVEFDLCSTRETGEQ